MNFSPQLSDIYPSPARTARWDGDEPPRPGARGAQARAVEPARTVYFSGARPRSPSEPMDCQLVGVAATLNTLLPPRRPGDRPQRFHRDAFSRLIEDERHVDVLLLHDWDQVVTTPENLHLWLKPDGLHFQCWPEKTVAGWRAVLGVQSGRFVGVSVRGEERRETVGGVDVIREIRLHEISLVILPHDSKTSVRYLSAEQAEKERQQRLSRLYRR